MTRPNAFCRMKNISSIDEYFDIHKTSSTRFNKVVNELNSLSSLVDEHASHWKAIAQFSDSLSLVIKTPLDLSVVEEFDLQVSIEFVSKNIFIEVNFNFLLQIKF
jgi:hypothetical protein